MKTIHYIAYGSNLAIENFYKRCPSAKLLGKSLLYNKTLVFKGNYENLGYITIEESRESTVPVGIYEISYLDLLKLDNYEGYPTLYSRQYIILDLNGKKIKALIYIMNKDYDYQLPSIEYFKTCIKGYEDFKFNKDYLIQALKITEEKKNKVR